jgi:hypothetical protein
MEFENSEKIILDIMGDYNLLNSLDSLITPILL